MNSVKMARAGKAIHALGATVGVLLFSMSLFSQGNFGRILGTVTDQSGGVISGATVTVLDTQRGVARTLTTDQAGEYSAPTLIPGDYTVRVEAKGFKRVDRQNVVLEVGKEVRVDLTVQPGDQAQTITVTEAAPLVETTNATLGGTLNNTDINDMPLNGRNFQNLLSLRPGVMMQAGGSPWSQSTNNVRPDETGWMMDGVINVSFYDDRPVGNSSSALTDAATIVPIDAIQEFNLEENPKAEYGWKPGAVVNVGIRSGTNTLHGSVYGFYRSAKWDARNFFTPAPVNGTCVQNTAVPAVCDKLPTQLKQFGAVVGGPIKKDKLFFLAGYEGLRDLIGNIFPFPMPVTGSLIGQPLPSTCPTAADCSMVDAINAVASNGGGFNTARLSQVSLNLLGCTTGAAPANTACTGGLILNANANNAIYTSTFPNVNGSDNGIGKMDYVVNSKHRISGMFWTGYYKGTGQDHPTVNPLFGSGFIIRSLSTVENWIWTPSSTVVNEFRFGYDRLTNDATVGDEGIIPDGSTVGTPCTPAGCGGKGYPLNTGVTKGTGGLPNITIGPFGGGLGNPNGGRPMGTGPSPYFDFQDSVSYLRGAHALKFGAEITHIEADQNTTDFRGVDINFNGGLAFAGSTPLEDYFAGTPNLGSVTVGNGVRKMVWWHYAGFVQDDWRIKPRLMLNLGLRYEYNQPMREVNNLLGNFDPNSSTGIVQQGQPGVGSTLWKPDHKDFSPRVGFAWDVTGKGTTVLRGGTSVMYTTLFARAFMDNGPQNGSAGNIAVDPSGACNTFVPTVPAGQTCASVGGKTFGGTIDLGQPTFTPAGGLNWSSTVPAFPQGELSCTANAQCTIYALDPHLKTPYMVNYNFGVQHSFGSNLSLDVSYVGNRGYNLLTQTDVNQCQLDPGGSCIRPYDGHAASTGHAASLGNFPYLQIINEQTNAAHSNYNSLQATLTQRTTHGLDFTAGYTYGHGLDNGSLNFQGQTPQDSTHPEREYASGDFDIRHRLTVTAGYAIPGKKGYGQLLEGWKLNTIVTFQTAQPWLVLDGATSDDFSTGGSGVGDLTDRWNITGNPADFRSGADSIPYCAGPPVLVGGVLTSQCSQTSVAYGTSTSTPDGWSKCQTADALYSSAANPSTLTTAGCFVSRNGNSVITPNALGTFGNMGRNIFRDSGYKNVDFSMFKVFKFRERFGAEFRWELFNIFNHPNIANPYGSSNTSFLGAKLNNHGSFGSGGSTPDVAAGNPLVGSGSSRVMQLGLKLSF
jgi:Carboxypeptidase regulatory-like domain/TonB dependent receptor